MKLKEKEDKNGTSSLILSVDRYTKTVLTAIAVCLILIVINLYFSPGKLQAVQSVMDVNLKSINGNSFSGSELPVDIHSIKGSDIWNSQIPVDLKSVNGNYIFGSDVPVRVR